MKHIYTGKSLFELKDIYGIGKGGFAPYSDWWGDEVFAKDKPEAGEYELNIETKQLNNLSYGEQLKALPKGFEMPHPAVLAEALLSHFKATGKYLMEDWYSRSSSLDSEGGPVLVGYFANGLHVSGYKVDSPRDNVGVVAVRKLSNLEPRKLDPLDPYHLELRKVAALERIATALEKSEKPNKKK